MNKLYKTAGVTTKYFLISFVLTLALLFVFYLQTTGIENALAFFYVVSIPAYYYIILLLISLLLTPLGLVSKLKYFILVPKVLFDIFLLADIFVFRIYRFHIDMMFVNMLLHDFKGIGLSNSMLFYAILAFTAIIFINFWVYRMVDKKMLFNTIKINILILLVFLINQFTHIWAYDYNQKYITKYTPYFPYYFPTISHSLMGKLQKNFPNQFSKPSYNPDNEAKDILNSGTSSGTIFNYPIKELTVNDTINTKPNILLFLTESWRADMMTKDVTPNIYTFSKSCYNYKNHKSSGNVTVAGLFGLLYGLHPSYLQYAQAEPYKNQTLLTKTLKENDYTISAYTPSNLDRFALKPMFFGHISDNNYIYQISLSTVENDRYVVDALLKDIKKDTLGKPWFKFIFLNASHHSYKYPEEHKLFLPVPDNSEGFVFNKNINSTPFINDYKNSLHYVDSLFEEIYSALKEQGLLENTILIVTSDHAEEFNENNKGYWGHGSNFTKYQTTVPFLLKLPRTNDYKEINQLTGHIDLVPTLLTEALGVKNETSDYSSGVNLLDSLPKNRGLIISSYVDKAYVIKNMVYANGLSFKSYKEDNIDNQNNDFDYNSLKILRLEETKFLKH